MGCRKMLEQVKCVLTLPEMNRHGDRSRTSRPTRPRRSCAAALPIRPAPAACRRARGRVSRFGASLKDLGKKCFGFTKMDAAEIPGLKARL